jgi:hypothetical protein
LVPPLTGLTRHMFIDLVIVIKSRKVGTPLTGLARHMFIDLVIVIKSGKVGTPINRFSPSYVNRSSHSYKEWEGWY